MAVNGDVIKVVIPEKNCDKLGTSYLKFVQNRNSTFKGAFANHVT